MAAAATPPGVVDPTKPAKYPVILSDALLGKSPKEILTAIRYNHKPILSSDHAPDEAQLTPSSASPNAYDLSYNDDGKYAFHGSRVTKENQYVLIFDPERKAFVLHRVDSTFNMNLIRTPATSDAEALKDEYPHLDTATGRIASSSQADKKKAGPAAKGAGKGKKAGGAGMFMENKKTAAAPKKSAAGGNSNKKEAAAAAASSAGAAEKKDKDVGAAEKDKKPKQQAQQQRNRSPVGSEDEDSDDGFIIEYPDPVDTASLAVPPGRSFRNESPGPSTIRKFDDFLSNQAEESDEDADAEYEEEDFLIEEGGDSSGDNFKLPSPLGRNNNNNTQGGSGGGGGGEEVDDDTPEDDELMAMLEEEIGEGGGGMDVDSESSVSEED